jgi:prepilin-type N-terminal cleavage/methylation domain-containing protein/prepilin-type processing-associated H-X9-DG protein
MFSTKVAPADRRGFTLIELLVVIAIIAILAAILFPVFAQAREKARAISCLSNVKQIGTAFYMYVQDYDETTPSLGGSVPGIWDNDYTNHLYPYIKNAQVFSCPDRTDQNALENPDGSNKGVEIGYGYNWGPIQRRGGGLLLGQQYINGTSGNKFIPGITLAAMVSPAQLVGFGDSYDTPRLTATWTFLLCTYTGTHNSSLRHSGGHFNFGFSDGHAKNVFMRAGYIAGAENNEFAIPRAIDQTQYWCADPNATSDGEGSNAAASDGIPVPLMQCGQYGQYIYQNFPPCQNGATSSCMMPD